MNQNRLFWLSFIFNISFVIPALIYLKEPGINQLSFSELSILIILVFHYLTALHIGFTKKAKYFFILFFFSCIYSVITSERKVPSDAYLRFFTEANIPRLRCLTFPNDTDSNYYAFWIEFEDS